MPKKQKTKLRPFSKLTRTHQIVILVVAFVGTALLINAFALTRENVQEVFVNRSDDLISSRGAIEVDERVRFATAEYVKLEYSEKNGRSSFAKYEFETKDFVEKNMTYQLCQFGKVTEAQNSIIKLKVSAEYGGVQENFESFDRLETTTKDIKSIQCVPFVVDPDRSNDKEKAKISYEVHVLKDPQLDKPANRRSKREAKADVFLKTVWLIKPNINEHLSPLEIRDEVNHPCPNPFWERQVWGTVSDEFGSPVPAQIGVDFTPILAPGQTRSDWDKANPEFAKEYSGLYENLVLTNISHYKNNTVTKWCAPVPQGIDEVYIENAPRPVKLRPGGPIVNNSEDFGNSINHATKLSPDKVHTRADIVLPNVCGTVNNSKDNTGRIFVNTYINGNKIENGYRTDDLVKAIKDNAPISTDRSYPQPYRIIAFPRGQIDEGADGINGYGDGDSERGGKVPASPVSGLEPRQRYFLIVQTQKSWNENGVQTHWKYIADVDPGEFTPHPYVHPCNDTYVDIEITDAHKSQPNTEILKDPSTYDEGFGCRVRVWYEGQKRPADSEFRKAVNSRATEPQYGNCSEIYKVPVNALDTDFDR